MKFIFADRIEGMWSLTLLPVRRVSLLIPALLLAGLTACVPRTKPTAPPIGTETKFDQVSFYPHESGAVWTYLPEGDAADSPPYTLKVDGPTVYAEQAVIQFHMTGRGADQLWYRTFAADGVRLLGLHKPGVNVSLQPAWLESPAQTAWKLGLSWQGQSQVTISDDSGKVQAQGTLNYSYVVQEKRHVKIPGGEYDVWVVTRQMSDTVGGLFPATQQFWFTPYAGEIRTPEGLLQTGRNYTLK